VDPVPGTPFGVVQLDVPAITSGPAVAALSTGIGSVLVAFVVGCFGLAGAEPGWGGWVAGAFAVLAGLLGLAAVALGEVGRRQTRRPGPPSPPGPVPVTTGPAGSPVTGAPFSTAGAGPSPEPAARPASGPADPARGSSAARFTGRGLAIAGMSCGGVGLALTLLALAVAVLLQA
jgi:hypothetical protein